jgi:hypothetical protein
VNEVFAGKVPPSGGEKIPVLYVAIDGTGVPLVPWELEGVPGKDPQTGRAKMREAKLGCVFTQTALDDDGYPVRDDKSTTYTGAIENAEQFGRRIYAEALRRGLARATRVVVLGDGAPWISNVAAEHFPDATRILDLFHAREHVSEIAKTVYGAGSELASQWIKERFDGLDEGKIADLLRALLDLHPRGREQKDVVRRNLDYFKVNAEAMRYDLFRADGLFVGSGVVEAGCRNVIGLRLKRSGMKWTIEGANSIIALRCYLLGLRWEELWNRHRTA